MDGSRFDALTKGLAAATPARRTILRGLLGAAVASVAGRGLAAADGPTCPNHAGCERVCKNTNKVCACVKISHNKRVCIHPCCSDRRCSKDGQCKHGEVCIKTNCCGERVCVTRCTEPRPDYCGGTMAAAAGVVWS